jgi:hypothetical protein
MFHKKDVELVELLEVFVSVVDFESEVEKPKLKFFS